MKERPFDDYRFPITESQYFFGRTQLIKDIIQAPFQIRLLLGGRGIGKTSLLRAVQWNFIKPEFNETQRAFPIESTCSVLSISKLI